MGLLSKGTPLPWTRAKEYADHVRHHGILQFLNIYRRLKDRKRDCLLWGDEIEYCLVALDQRKARARLDLRAADILARLENEEAALLQRIRQRSQQPGHGVPELLESSWKPEYARYMLEGTPGVPYGANVRDLLTVEANMIARRRKVEALLGPDQILLTLTSFPLLGTEDCLYPHYEPRGEASHSLFIPDQAITPHARFPTLTSNIRQRRGSKVAINIPIFKDERMTDLPFVETFPIAHWPEDGSQDALPDHIYMDCMCFGMGCSCLQITFQACNIDEARHLYDQLTPISPIMLALTAAAPVFRGYLADVDCRWTVISRSVDDRTREERGVDPLNSSRFRIPKSRYDSVSTYLSRNPPFKPKYNDVDIPCDEDIRSLLLKEGIDEHLARHVSHLFIRDPLVIYQELLDQDDSVSSDHFENIQSTNWQTMRFKPPPPNSPIGWRVEFRSMEIQFTEFENAAFAIFVVLLTRAILSFNVNFYIPISKVDENMDRAQKRDAIHTQKFHFRRRIFHWPDGSKSPRYEGIDPLSLHEYSSPSLDAPIRLNGNRPHSRSSLDHNHLPSRGRFGAPISAMDDDSFEEMTLDEIMNGKIAEGDGDPFPGLISLIDLYLNSMGVDVETREHLNRYLDLVRKRASGDYSTNASWIRQFIRNHPSYERDSRVTADINFDMCNAIHRIVRREDWPTELFGDEQTEAPSSQTFYRKNQ